MKISLTVTESWPYKSVGNNNQRDITWKPRKGGQSFLRATRRSDLIHIPIKLHEDILNCYRNMERTRMFEKKKKKKSKGHDLESKKEGAIIIVRDTSSWPNTYSFKVVWRYPLWLRSYVAYKNSGKNNQRGITWKLRKGGWGAGGG